MVAPRPNRAIAINRDMEDDPMTIRTSTIAVAAVLLAGILSTTTSQAMQHRTLYQRHSPRRRA
jgi:hypothetical protein